MSEWISIFERQPIEGREVLIAELWGNLPIVAYLRSDGTWASDKSHIDVIGDARLDDCIERVTHWMPLPELPPQEERER